MKHSLNLEIKFYFETPLFFDNCIMHIMYFNNIWYLYPFLSSLSSALEQFLTPTYSFPIVFHSSSLFYFMHVRVWCMFVCLQCEYRVCYSSDGKVPWQSGAKGCHKHTAQQTSHTTLIGKKKLQAGGCLCMGKKQQKTECLYGFSWGWGGEDGMEFSRVKLAV